MRINRHFHSLGVERLEQRHLLSGTPMLLADVNPGGGDSNPTEFVEVGDTVFFTADSVEHGRELFRVEGNDINLVRDIRAGEGSSSPTWLTEMNGQLLFSAWRNKGEGTELWKSDGTNEGTDLVKDIFASPHQCTDVICPGLGPTADSYPNDLVAVGNSLFFEAGDDSNGSELWISDATLAGTIRLTSDLTSVNGIMPLNEGVIFLARDEVRINELWASDGTQEGTQVLTDMEAPHGPENLHVDGGRAYFKLETKIINRAPRNEIWVTDGTIGGTRPLVVPELQLWGPLHVTPSGDVFYLNAANGPRELWKSSSEGDASRVKSFNRDPSGISGWTTVGDLAYFVVHEEGFGRELWRTDGTELGTVLVKDILKGDSSSTPEQLTNVLGQLYFTADDGIHGRELWRSDGTEEGTALVADIMPGLEGSDPQELSVNNGTLFFSADDGVHGREPWSLPAQLPGDIDGDGTVAFADFLILSGNFGTDVTPYTDGDIDGDGSVQFADFLVLAENFGRTVAAVEVS